MANKFPPVGKIYQAKFGELAYHLNFDADGKSMTFTSIGTAKPVAEPEIKVNYTATEVADMVFMVTWKEPRRLHQHHFARPYVPELQRHVYRSEIIDMPSERLFQTVF